MFDPFGITVGGESDGLRGCGFVPVAFGEGGDHFPPRRTHSGHRSGRTAQWNWSIGAGGHRARGGWKPSLSHTHKGLYIETHAHCHDKCVFLFYFIKCVLTVSCNTPSLITIALTFASFLPCMLLTRCQGSNRWQPTSCHLFQNIARLCKCGNVKMNGGT